MTIQPLLFASMKREDALKDLQPNLHAEIINCLRLSTSNMTGTKLDIAFLSFLSSFLFLHVYTIVHLKNKTLKWKQHTFFLLVYLIIKFKYFFPKDILERVKVTVGKERFSLAFSRVLGWCLILLYFSGSRAKASLQSRAISHISMGRFPGEHLRVLQPSSCVLTRLQAKLWPGLCSAPYTHYRCNHLCVNPFVDLGLSGFENPTHMGHP